MSELTHDKQTGEPAITARPLMPHSLARRLAAAGLLWVLTVGAGYTVMLRYELSPGHAGKLSERWPEGSLIERAPDRATLVMLAHPRCPCTRASLKELSQVMTRCGRDVDAYVLFYRPTQHAAEWARTALWRQADSIPGVRVLPDDDGMEAQRLGAATSGHVVVYDETGRQRFSGGITSARGHEGDNGGRAAVIRLLKREPAGGRVWPVFGCSLRESRLPGGEGANHWRQ